MFRAGWQVPRTVPRMLPFPRRRAGHPPLVIGHRGAGRGLVELPDGRIVAENTTESFLAAADLGAPWVETDAVRTADHDLVLHHDTVLPDGTPILDLTTSECHALGIPALTRVLDVLPEHVGVVLEAKEVLDDVTRPVWEGTTGLLAAHAHLERATRPGRPLLTYSFTPDAPHRLDALTAELGLELPVGVIAEGGTDLGLLTLAAVRTGAAVVAAHVSSCLGPRARQQMAPRDIAAVVAAGHRAGLAYLVWCPTPDQVVELAAAGVDAVCVDDIPGTMSVVEEL